MARLQGGGEGYLALCGGRLLGTYPSLPEALWALRGCGEDAIIVYGRLVAQLTVEELAALTGAAEAPSRPAGGSGEAAAMATAQRRQRRGSGKPRAAVVLDQMFKTFSEVLDRELKDLPLEFHEVLGRGIEKPVKAGERIIYEPARDDYDILNLLERLASTGARVIFFTGDKRLAQQARSIDGVVVEYLPPGEAGGKEQALKLMASRIRSHLEGPGGG